MGRHDDAYDTRVKAAKLAKDRNFENNHQDNGEEDEYEDKDGHRNFIANYTKGFRHHPKTDRDAGEVINADYRKLVDAMESGDPDDFEDLTLGGPPPTFGRQLTSPQAGLMFDLEGPDSQDIGIRKAPRIDSAEAAGEMAEVYWMALCRDIRFDDFGSDTTIGQAVTDLSTNYSDFPHPFPKPGSPVEPITNDTIFRGVTKGDRIGPYLSQFLYQPIPWGSQTLEQVQRIVKDHKDYLIKYDEWLEAQDGKDIKDPDDLETNVRPILTPRDLAYYVHVDALYQAYLGACLILLNTKNDMTPPKNVYSFDPLLPYQKPGSKQMGFAVFGGPHILSLVTEVATRALKAVWFQKWGVHRRLRPEAFGGLIHRQLHFDSPTPTPGLTKPDPSYETKIHGDILGKTGPNQILEKIRSTYGSYLLPQAFPEGSPTHPSYGAGHATVAGACVTILKAWFNEDDVIFKPKKPDAAGTKIVDAPELIPLNLKVGDELNKLAANIAIGRNWAGVHYRSDYTESILLGEQIALGVLQEQATCYHKKDPFACRLTRFDGQKIEIKGTEITVI
jgi:membrane-associated phospholipid phosphatase